MPRILNAIAFLFVGTLIGSAFPNLGAAKQYRLQQGQTFWVTASEREKTTYLLGYLDAETIYRSNMDLKLKPLCTMPGQKWVDDFEFGFPLLQAQSTILDLQKGLEELYANSHRIGMFPAQRIVRLKLAGRPQSEIDAAERETQVDSRP